MNAYEEKYKESEDKKIRNEIILYIGAKDDISLDTHNKWLSWLEKQGEQKSIQNEKDEKIRKYLMNYVEHAGVGHSLFDDVNTRENILTWLEKQGNLMKALQTSNARIGELIEENYYLQERLEKQGDVNALIQETYKRAYTEGMRVERKHWTEKQGEQKPADKVEPKFHEGDWVVDNCGNVWKIEGILNQFYILEGIEGEESRPTIEWGDKTFHPWTIQDAQDGDVLAAGPIDNYHFPFIAIYKNRGLDFFNSYCFIGFDGKFYEGDTGHALDDIHPAAKEQYDLLLQKMHDAGYEFDFEQKELKEIELTKSESEEELSDFEAALFSAFSDGWLQYLHGEEVDFAQWAKEHSAELLEAANQNHVALSEEDEDYYDAIIAKLEVTQDDAALTDNQMEFLKSLKDRIVPQSQQEWGEEDEKMVIALMSICDEWATRHSYLPEENNDIEKIKSWLKSLRPQKQWKPSDVQMQALKEACDKHWEPDGLDPLYTLYEHLKKL